MTADEMQARIERLEQQRQKYWRHMWRAVEVLREVAPERVDPLIEEWDREVPS